MNEDEMREMIRAEHLNPETDIEIDTVTADDFIGLSVHEMQIVLGRYASSCPACYSAREKILKALDS